MAKRKQLMLAAVRSRQAATAVIGARLRERDPKERRCSYEDCGRAFGPRRAWQRFCSERCRYKAWELENPRVRIKRARSR
jgi:hypothetical protein